MGARGGRDVTDTGSKYKDWSTLFHVWQLEIDACPKVNIY